MATFLTVDMKDHYHEVPLRDAIEVASRVCGSGT
jgi:hypothetical protein